MFSGCGANTCPHLPGGSDTEALRERAYIELMYQFNRSHCPEATDLYTKEAVPPKEKPLLVPMLKTVSEAKRNFDFKVLDISTTNAVVQMTSLNPKRFNWSVFGGAVNKQEWVLDGGNWKCDGVSIDDDPFMELVDSPESNELAQ